MIDRGQRRYWAEERERRCLAAGDGQFARRGLMALLDEPRVLVATLPADPLRPAVDLRDDVLAAAVLPQAFRGQTANGVSSLSYLGRTGDTMVRYARPGREDARWRAFAAIRSDGGIEVGFGSVAAREYGTESPLRDRLGFRLFVLVHAVRVAIATQTRLCQHTADLGPFELIVALHMPEGTILNAFASGWERPEYAFEVATALEAHPVVREEVEPMQAVAKWPADAPRSAEADGRPMK